jgi:uncharacterized membrane protein
MTTAKMVRGAVIAALYFALTMLLAPISFGPVQFRVAEALCVLPFLYAEAIPGLFVGCLLSNLLGGNGLLDVLFGSLATLAAAIAVYKCRVKWLVPLFPVIVNGIVVGAVLAYVYTPDTMAAAFPLFAAEVAAGELGVCYLIGLPLLLAMERVTKRKTV